MTEMTTSSSPTEANTPQIVTKVPNRIRIVQTGDIHFVHNRTPTANVIRTMNYLFYENESMKDIDLIVLAGDVWDSLTTMPNGDAELARCWVHNFVSDCEANGVILRVLEGTPDHDRKQSREFVLYGPKGDIKYIDQLCVEHIPRLDLWFLWVPDEIRINHEEIWKATCEVMAAAGLEKVDFAIVHGAFDFHFPPEWDLPAHSSERYSAIVRYAVLCNHIHKKGHRNKVWGPGSPDRLAHNEEEAKGYHRITLIPSEVRMELQWIENPHAWIYRAINTRGKELDEIIALARKVATPLPYGSWVRLDFGDPTIMSGALVTLRTEIPHVQWEIKNEKKKGIVADKTIYKQERFTGVQITPDNSLGVLTHWLQNKNLLRADQEPIVQRILDSANQEM